MDIQTLAKEYDALEKRGIFADKIPNFILENLNQTLTIRPYQQKAVNRFLFYFEKDQNRTKPSHLLFHMATGSGKTLLMAASILYFYAKGYRNFIFFVDKTNIILKTKANFLNKLSPKYLFNDKVVIDGKDIIIQEVENFSLSNPDAINIFFTTISGLHSKIQTPQENTVTKTSFARGKTIFISDEAHHINAKTRRTGKKLTQEQEDALTWEHTIEELVHSNENNVLLEYTATIQDTVVSILEKYADKIIYEYSLKQFRTDKYSKEVYVYQSGAPLEDRMLQAVVLSQYRRKLAAKHHISLKPVLLMKSKTIDLSKVNFELFKKVIAGLKKSDLLRLEKNIASEDEGQVLRKAFKFFKNEKVSIEELVSEIKIEFAEDRCVEVNTKEQSEEKQITVNTLEDEKNIVRVVFAVNMLNEGWDVLNLFDIVRLYDTRDSRFGTSGKTTIAEAQLIGRGARYYPFTLSPDEDRFTRKYDEDLANELRVLEQLYYHSLTDNKYISELRKELVKTGIQAADEDVRRVTVKLKDAFKMTVFYKKALVFKNAREKNTRENIKDLKTFGIEPFYSFNLIRSTLIGNLFESDLKGKEIKSKPVIFKIKDLPQNLVLKALDKIDFYSFNELQKYLPNLTSRAEFISSNKYCGNIDIEFIVKAHNGFTLHSKEVLVALISVFENVKTCIIQGVSEFVGTQDFEYVPLKSVLKDEVTMEIATPRGEQERGRAMSGSETRVHLPIPEKKWYAFDENYGTDQEKYFLTFIDRKMAELKKEFDDVCVVRNEKFVKLYAFETGEGVEPDFLLYAVSRKKKKKGAIYYQLFIEPKGSHLVADEGWKQEFLKQIKKHKKLIDIAESPEYRVYGLPFFNNDDTARREFEKALGAALKNRVP